MGNIIVHEFMALDGVIENPAFTFEYPFDQKMGVAIARVMSSCKAILLGRKTFEMFAPAWSVRTAKEDPGAPFMNKSPKYVVSSHPTTEVEWNNSKIIGTYSPESIRRLKDEVDGGIYVSGSGTLVRAMLANGLVDRLELFMFPVAVGKGARLFDEASGAPIKFELAGSEAYTNGVLHLSYELAPQSKTQES